MLSQELESKGWEDTAQGWRDIAGLRNDFKLPAAWRYVVFGDNICWRYSCPCYSFLPRELIWC